MGFILSALTRAKLKADDVRLDTLPADS